MLPLMFEQATYGAAGVVRVFAAHVGISRWLVEQGVQLFDFTGPHNSHPGQQFFFRALDMRAWPLDAFELAKMAHIAVFRAENVLQNALNGSATRRLLLHLLLAQPAHQLDVLRPRPCQPPEIFLQVLLRERFSVGDEEDRGISIAQPRPLGDMLRHARLDLFLWIHLFTVTLQEAQIGPNGLGRARQRLLGRWSIG